MAMEFSRQIANDIETFLQLDDWHFDPVNENGQICFGVSLKCKLQSVDCEIRVRDDGFLMLSIVKIKADEDSRAAVAEYITRANYGMFYGGFEMDMRDGEVRFRTTCFAGNEDVMLSSEQIKHAIYLNLSMIKRYGNGLLTVMMGFQTPEEAIAQAEAD